MKANQKIRSLKKEQSAVVQALMGILVLVLIASSIIGVIAAQSENAVSNASTDAKTDTIIDLWPFMVIIGIFLAIVRFAV